MILAEKNKPACAGRQNGVSLIMAFFVMVIVISVVLSVSSLLYSEIKIIRNMSDSVISFYAADSGIEKLLYYDRKVSSATGQRGLCRMCYSGVDRSCVEAFSEPSLNCRCDYVSPFPDCDIDNCINCKITFYTSIDGTDNGRYYSVTADVSPTAAYDMNIKSNGFYKSSGRAINVVLDKPAGGSPAPPPAPSSDECLPETDNPQIKSTFTPLEGCPFAVYKGQNCFKGDCNKMKITISAYVFDPDGIRDVTFYVKDLQETILDSGAMTSSGGGDYLGIWQGSYSEDYLVDITATDRLENFASVTNIIPIPEPE